MAISYCAEPYAAIVLTDQNKKKVFHQLYKEFLKS